MRGVMMRGVFVAVVAVVVSSTCSVSAQSQQISDVLQPVMDAWYNCVFSSAHSFVSLGQDKNIAAENAFVACRTEEQLIFALVPELSQNFINQYRLLIRMGAKKQIINSR